MAALSRKLEDAWIAALDAVTSVDVRRWRDQSVADSYPVALVHASPAQDDDASVSGALTVVDVELAGQSYVDADATQSVVDGIVETAETLARSAGILANLNARLTGCAVRGIEVGTVADTGDDRIHSKSITATCYVQAT